MNIIVNLQNQNTKPQSETNNLIAIKKPWNNQNTHLFDCPSNQKQPIFLLISDLANR